MKEIKNIVKTFNSFQVVKSFLYLIIVWILTNMILMEFQIFWYLKKIELLFLSSLIFITITIFLFFFLKITRLYSYKVLFSIFILLLIKIFIIDIQIVKGDSMMPSIKNRQIVIIDKFHYGWNLSYFVYPFRSTRYKKICLESICKLNSLQRYDIIIFDFPDPVTKKRLWIKRIIGFPLEEYEFKNHFLYINHNKIDIFNNIEFMPEYHATPIFDLPEELKEYDAHYQYYFMNGTGIKGIIPENTLLLLGDNTTKSRDSRIYGFIPLERIYGKVIYVF